MENSKLSISSEDFLQKIEMKKKELNDIRTNSNMDIANAIICFITRALNIVHKHDKRYPLKNSEVSNQVLGLYLEDLSSQERSSIIINEDKVEINLYFGDNDNSSFLPASEFEQRKTYYDEQYVNDILSEYGITIDSKEKQNEDDYQLITITQSMNLIKKRQDNAEEENIQPKLTPRVE